MGAAPTLGESDGASRCARCGRAFRPTRATMKYCTAVCRISAGEARRVERRAGTRKHGGLSTGDISPPRKGEG